MFQTPPDTRHRDEPFIGLVLGPERPDVLSHKEPMPVQQAIDLMARETIEIPLTADERSLLLRYGYPFERIESALKSCEASHGVEIVPMDRFELERLIGDVCRSLNHMTGGATQDQLLELCDRLEAAEQSGDGMRDVL